MTAAPFYSGHQCSRMASTLRARLERRPSILEITGPVPSSPVRAVVDGVAFTAIDPETALEYEVRVTPRRRG